MRRPAAPPSRRDLRLRMPVGRTSRRLEASQVRPRRWGVLPIAAEGVPWLLSMAEVVAVGMMLPNELIWIMDKMGLEWPDIDEDEVHKAADLVRGYRDDMESIIQAVDSR